jgi:hypothetical protein
MKTLLLFLFLTAPQVVYICGSAKGKKYHLRADCRGLSSCQHKIRKMALADAQKNGWTLCKWEK